MDDSPRLLTRRRILEGLVLVPAGAVLASACGGEASKAPAVSPAAGSAPTATPVPTTAAVPTPTAAAVPTAAPTAAPTATTAAAEATPALVNGWASGGTDLIAVDWPTTSLFDSVDACALSLTQGTTEGPCYFASDTGADISLGKTGLPMQLCLRLVDPDCGPLVGHVIEVWHCDVRGTYSGNTSGSDDAGRFAGGFCTGGDAEAEAATYFRGQMTTDAEGRVNFKTCFPGWYSGRTIHIHFAVSDPDGTTRVISQFGFTDAFADEVCTTHDLYMDRGVQDTSLARDNVFPSADNDGFLLATQKNTDGTLLGLATIQIDPTQVVAAGSRAGR